MPEHEKKSTLLRQWDMMRMLVVSRYDNLAVGEWSKASEIAEKLKESGYKVTVRTVQRDLKELSSIFPIELNDKNSRDYGWRWQKGAGFAIPGISSSEALALHLAQLHLRSLLPTAMLNELNGLFALAKTKLDNLAQHKVNPARDWLDKIRVIQPTQPLLPPWVNPGIQSEIYRAVLENCQIEVIYNAFENAQEKSYELHPLGIIMRGSVTYLAASARDYKDVRLYALHRFSHVTRLDKPTKVPAGFNLDSALAEGLADFSNQPEPIQLAIRCDTWLAAYLRETPLATDQTIQPETDDWVRITATVNDTWQLRWWLMGQGARLEVCAPAVLRAEIKAELLEAVKMYK